MLLGEKNVYCDVVFLNVVVVLKIVGCVEVLCDGVEIVVESIDFGVVLRVVEMVVRVISKV